MNNILYILALVAAIWVIYDVLVNQKGMKGINKVLWIVFAFLFSIITAIIYYFTQKK